MVTKLISFPNLLVSLIVVVWLVFAFTGIKDNHSFWTDESNVALYSRQILETGRANLPVTGYSTGWYQVGYQYSLALLFSIFGISEFAARLLSLIAGSGVLVISYLLVKRVTGSVLWGIISIIGQGWWAINLAYSTQTRPYMILQLCVLSLCLLSLKFVKDKNWIFSLYILLLVFIATLFHSTGLFLSILYLIYVVEFLSHKIKFISNWRWLIFGIVNIGFGLALIFGLRYLGLTGEFNNLVYLKYIVRHHLWFLVIPFGFGSWSLLKNYRVIGVGILSYSFWVFIVWLFFSYSYNIRYLIPLIGLIVVVSFIGLAEIYKLSKIFLPIRIGLVGLILITFGSQLVWWPKSYYSPNVWLYGDVQNADYKSAYGWMVNKYGQELNGWAIFDSWNDRTLWYLRRPPDAMFVVSSLVPDGQKYDVTSGAYFYTTLEQFKAEQSKYPQGLVLVEEWQSTMPEEIKQYIRQSLKLEYTVNGLTTDQIDQWPLAIYSWGSN